MPENGYIVHMDTAGIGSVCASLGAGRMKKEDVIDSSAGIVLRKKTGDYAEKGDVIAVLYANNDSLFESAGQRFLSSLKFGNEKTEFKPLVLNTVE